MNETIKKELKTEDSTLKNLLDSSNKGIPDDWQINGYTVDRGLIVKWDEAIHAKNGYIKYTSDPYEKSTTGDPYSDIDKVLGKIDKGILIEARHPLVAAYPLFGLTMEKLIISKNENVSSEKGKSLSTESSNTITQSMSNSSTDSTTLGVSTGVHASLFDFGASVDTNVSHEWSTTVTKEKSESSTTGVTKGETWTQSLGLNKADTAFLTGNIRYVNFATAPIYEVKPTLNFVLGVGRNAQTIATITAKSNTLANFLLPNSLYPNKKQNAIAWNTSDDFNSQPIKLNFDQVNMLDADEKLRIETTQISGYYKKYSFDHDVEIFESQKWEYIMTDIYSRTACITVSYLDGTAKQRRVAARKAYLYNSQTQPELTFGEALEIAFLGAKVTKINGNYGLFYGKLEPANITVAFDEATYDRFKEALIQNDNFDIYNVKLTQGMNILIREEKFEAVASVQNELEQIMKDLRAFSNINNRFDLGPQFNDKKVGWENIVKKIQHYLLEKHYNPLIISKIKINSLWKLDLLPLSSFRPDSGYKRSMPFAFLYNERNAYSSENISIFFK